MHFINAQSPLKILADLFLPPTLKSDCAKEMRPEALTMLQDGPDLRRTPVLSDGTGDGAAAGIPYSEVIAGRVAVTSEDAQET